MKTPRLKAYRDKRRFDRTPEPSGGASGEGEPIFVVQKHAAQRLHYDLRLQVGDTLRSWAVPEGPSLDTKVRRFAKQVEDHPLDYAAFEGRIPEGEYGGGTVIVWDRGTWASVEDPGPALERGELKFRLAGEKLRGGWMLKRLPDDPTNWLLIKERDPAARPTAEYDVVVEAPDSVITGVPVEISSPQVSTRRLSPPVAGKIPGAVAAPFPNTWRPQLASPAALVPPGADWVHEIKYDGYRTLCLFDHGDVRLLTRNGLDWTDRYGALAKAFAGLPCKTALIDGEVVVQDPRGVTRVQLLKHALSTRQTHAFTFFAFDLCHLDGFDLSAARLVDRKQALEALTSPLVRPNSAIQLSQHVDSDGAALFARACELGLEGVISKKADSKYVQQRSNDWVKIKRVETGDFVIIGYTLGAPQAVAALVLAEERDGELHSVGKVGSGFSEAMARGLYKSLAPITTKQPAAKTERLAGAKWVAPSFTAKVGYRDRTASGSLWHAVLLKVSPGKQAPTPAKALKPRLVMDRDLAAIQLTNPNREMFAGSGVTKLDIALHYARVGDFMLPELLRRPLTFLRCTTGEIRDCFYQRHGFAGLPDGVEQVELSDEEGRAAFISVVEPKGYLALAQFGAVEMHLWGCHIDDPDHADRLVMDLDPAPDVAWGQVCDAAEALRARLEGLGFAPFLRTTGGKGLHLVMALGPGQEWPRVKGFAHAFAKSAAREAPQFFTAAAAKAKRPGKIFIDYLRNARGATAVASYSLRARDGFPVATPIAWDELRTLTSGDAFTIHNIQNRLNKDPWNELQSTQTIITARMAREVGMVS